MRTVHVVTHPEASHHVDDLVGGWFDSELTPAGLDAAAAIGAALRERIPTGPVEVVSSDLRRTAQTAAAVARALDVDGVRLDGDLREKSYGAAEGRPQGWLDERFLPPPHPATAEERLDHHEGLVGSETRRHLATRVYRAVARLLAAEAEQQVVITHGFALTFVVAAWVGMPLAACGWVSLPVPSGSITELHEDDFFHNRAVRRLGDVAHLDVDAS